MCFTFENESKSCSILIYSPPLIMFYSMWIITTAFRKVTYQLANVLAKNSSAHIIKVFTLTQRLRCIFFLILIKYPRVLNLNVLESEMHKFVKNNLDEVSETCADVHLQKD